MRPAAHDETRDDAASNHWRTLASLAGHLWPRNRTDLRLRVFLASIMMVSAKLVSVYVPQLYKQAIDLLSAPTALVLPVGLIVAYGGARVIQQMFGELRDFLFSRVGQFAQRTIALRTFEHLHSLSLAFHLDRQTGGLSRAIERGTRGIQFVLSFMLFNILPTIIEILLVTGILLYQFDWTFGVIVFATITVYVGFTLLVTDWRIRFRRQMNKSDSEANTRAIDSLLNYETVKYFGNEQHEYDRYDRSLALYEKAAVRSQTSLSLLNTGQGLVIGVGLVSIMLLAANGIVEGRLSIGDFVLVNTYLIQLYLPLNFLGFVYREMKQSLIDMDRMFELLSVEPDIQDRAGAGKLKAHAGALEFSDVCFAYRPDRKILHDVSFRVPPGRSVALVGPSGSGKSTIARLLFRFYSPTSGRITIDGQDLSEVTQSSLRAAIGIVPQDTVLFNDTLGYNIRYGRPSATEEEIERAARLARIHDFIQALPEGYNTIVGERGLKLSGGERQRVAIARTILKNPPILLFDEATSALDSATEQEIQKSLRAVSENRTTLMIAHRLSTIVHANEILVLNEGRIVERGTHAELLLSGRVYADMWARQQEAREHEAALQACLSDA